MTKSQLEVWGGLFAQQIARVLPGEIKFTLVVACIAEDPAAEVQTHVSSAGNMSGREMAVVLGNVLHALEAEPDAVQFGRSVDLTPPAGPKS